MKSILVYTVHKAASMFLHSISEDVAKEFGITHYSPNNRGQADIYDEIRRVSWKAFIANPSHQGCFGPIRAGTADPILPDELAAFSVVLHLRDPRDVLTSLYYSSVYNHPRKEGRFNPSDEKRKQWEDKGVDGFALEQAPIYKQRYETLISGLLGRDNVTLLKYEDMVADYATWLDRFLGAFSHLSLPPKRRLGLFSTPNSLAAVHERLYEKYRQDFIPPAEDVHKHIRQLAPGDHERKLAAETISHLDAQFGDILRLLDYAIH
jgi:hypothetical protein